MRNVVLGFFGGLVVTVVCVFGYLRLGLAEVRADLPPPRWDRLVSSHSGVASGWDGVFGGTDFLGSKAWGPQNGNVRQRSVGLGR